MLKKVFRLIKKISFIIQIHDFFNHWLEPTCCFGFKRGDPSFFSFLIWVSFWKLIQKLSFAVEVAATLENYCPNQPDLSRKLKPHISMFHILDTKLWCVLLLLPSRARGGAFPKLRRGTCCNYRMILRGYENSAYYIINTKGPFISYV